MNSKVNIKNKHELVGTLARNITLDLIECGIGAVLPCNLLPAVLRFEPDTRILTVNGDDYQLDNRGRLFVIGGGKAAGLMAEALEAITGVDIITAGVVVTKEAQGQTRRIKTLIAGHPIPDGQGLEAVRQILALKEEYDIGIRDVVVSLLSGGASALMPALPHGLSLEDKQRTTELLMRSGADINEINIVRKHISWIKGGWLGKHFSPARVISLIISDVVGDDPVTIASGPTTADTSTFADAVAIAEKYHLMDELPTVIIAYLNRGLSGQIPETPKSLDNCRNYIIGNVGTALQAMAVRARYMGLSTMIITDAQTGDTAKTALTRVSEIMSGKFTGYDLLLAGGETTLALLPGSGIGGRNQHYTAVTLAGLAGYSNRWLVAGFGTDGSDYLPGIAGALADNETAAAIKVRDIDVADYVFRYDSYSLFDQIGRSLVKIEDTGTNVGDIVLYMLI